MGWLRRRKAHTEEDRVVIDLRDKPVEVEWGSPLPCPDCGGRGYLDHIDPFRDVMYMHCTECQVRYAVAKADIDALSR